MISIPIYEGDAVDRVCYLRVDHSTGAFEEMNEGDALGRPTLTVGAYSGSRMVQKVNFINGAAANVEYFDVSTPEVALEWHSENFAKAIGRAWSSYVRNDSGSRRVGYVVSNGRRTFGELIIEQLDADDDILSEERRTPDGQLIERLEYGYDDDKEIAETRIYGRDGSLIQLDRHDD
ncbi:hypothetical protein [Nocardia sp. NPDC052566]|uniref:hypothetical protein n=1 Tax=Nocardia sp. NPDC052566 TaxID=3364330 RepID=UPI0037CBED3B